MAQTSEGARKSRAKRSGTPLADVILLEGHGFKWCWKCKFWNPLCEYNVDNSRYDSKCSTCTSCSRVKSKKPRFPGTNPRTGKPGPAPKPWRDGDKTQARHQVVLAVRNGDIPTANELPCEYCGHVFDGSMRHEYHHHKGYGKHHFLDVVPLCRTCHGKATSDEYVACARGHKMEGENVGYTAEGRRFCRQCRRQRDKGRRSAEYWRN